MLIAAARYPSARNRALRIGITVVGGVALMTLAARAEVPFWPVPMTLQTMAVMAFALALGPRLAAAIFAAYLAAGATGMPVFAGSPARGIGLAYMAGPTGGYLLGMLLASWLVGALVRPGRARRGVAMQVGAMLLGMAVIYACGVAWLATFVPAGKLLAFGVTPFIAGDLVKIALVAVGSVLVTGWSRGAANLH